MQDKTYKKQVETGRGSRVLNRSNNNANANGGVAYVNANNDKMKQALDMAREKDMLPFTATIKADGGYGYIFT